MNRMITSLPNPLRSCEVVFSKKLPFTSLQSLDNGHQLSCSLAVQRATVTFDNYVTAETRPLFWVQCGVVVYVKKLKEKVKSSARSRTAAPTVAGVLDSLRPHTKGIMIHLCGRRR